MIEIITKLDARQLAFILTLDGTVDGISFAISFDIVSKSVGLLNSDVIVNGSAQESSGKVLVTTFSCYGIVDRQGLTTSTPKRTGLSSLLHSVHVAELSLLSNPYYKDQTQPEHETVRCPFGQTQTI